MRYIIIPTNVFEQADMSLAQKLGLSNPRKSIDGQSVIMHIESFNKLFSESSYPKGSYMILDSESEEFKELINSDIWTVRDE